MTNTCCDTKYSVTIDPAGSTIEKEPSGIVESYERVMRIFKKSSPMSNWKDLTMALHELGHSIYGKGN